jgi:hypothetical protein
MVIMHAIGTRTLLKVLLCGSLLIAPVGCTNNGEAAPSPEYPQTAAKIAFSSNRDGNFEIYVMNADGSNPARLTNNPAYDTSPDWSPGGAQIAFMSNRTGDKQIYIMNADGTNQLLLCTAKNGHLLQIGRRMGPRSPFTQPRCSNKRYYVIMPTANIFVHDNPIDHLPSQMTRLPSRQTAETSKFT